jgi:GT2 family glycosyltransferase
VAAPSIEDALDSGITLSRPLPLIGVVIVNWRRPSDTLRSLAALNNSTYTQHRVVVVENGSADESAAILRQAYPDLDLLLSTENLGYTGGNNLGIRRLLESTVDYILLLNDDAVIDADALAELAQAAHDHPQAGFLGPKILALESPETLLSAGGIFTTDYRAQNRGMGQVDRGQFDDAMTVDFISGCALLVKRQVIEKIGLLDEDFFAYHEEVDWCFRGRKAGFEIRLVPSARVWHPDTRTRDRDAPKITYYTVRNNLLFSRKHHLGWRIISLRLFGYYRTLLSWTVRPKWRQKRAQRHALSKALHDFWHGNVGPGFP